MNQTENTISMEKLNHVRFRALPCSHDFCITCGLCSSACPASGIDGFDPRTLVRMAGLGLENEIINARWPWICTMCGKCEHLCPMDIRIPDLVRSIRGLREKNKIPGILQKGLEAALKTGNNLGLPKEDFIYIVEDVAGEIAEEPGFEDFKVPIDKKGANLLSTIHNKLVNTHTEDLKYWWKIFHAAKEDWTITSENWEGTSWGLFTGDDEAVKIMAGRIMEQMKRLEIKNLLWPE
ncbi:MAG: 4Fe-4S dicluster domain-containing protein [Desulfobacteraceae bacterium]|nr:MAG: 4Fe-4S dicluster domain-containing protein [Desulfobacteraceae bacterium]